LWLWESAAGTDGAAARVASVDQACRGVALLTDATGAPASVLALTAAERAANAARTDGKRLALAPTGGVVARGVGYVYYDELLRGPGVFDVENLGTGLCTLAPGAVSCVRVADGAVLWAPDQQVLNQGGLIVGDRAILAGCRTVAAFEAPCTIA